MLDGAEHKQQQRAVSYERLTVAADVLHDGLGDVVQQLGTSLLRVFLTANKTPQTANNTSGCYILYQRVTQTSTQVTEALQPDVDEFDYISYILDLKTAVRHQRYRY